MTHIFCKGAWVELIERDGWFWCSGCGKNIWRSDATFALEGSGVPSEHGDEEDSRDRPEEVDPAAWGAIQA